MSEFKRKELYEKHLNRIRILVEGSRFYGRDKCREALKVPILESFYLLKYLSAGEDDDRFVLGLYEKFRENYQIDSKEELSVSDDDYSSKTDEELEDEANYLKISVENICECDIDSLTLEQVVNEKSSSFNYRKTADALAVYKNFLFTTEDPSGMGKLVDDLVLKSHAWERLNQDIDNGNIYIYKTKPERNVFVKNILSVLFAMGFLLSMALIISCPVNIAVSRRTDSNTDTHHLILLLAISIFSAVYFGISYCKLRQTFRNENYKYSFQRNTFYATFLFAIAFTTTFAIDKSNPLHLLRSLVNDAFSGYCLSTLLVTIIIVCVIYLIAYLYLQPEKDQRLVELTLEKHLSDITKTSTLNN